MRLPRQFTRSAALVASVAVMSQMTAAPAAAQLDERDIARWAACSFLGFRTSEAVVRREARQAGYRNIRNIKYVNRQRPNSVGCGFYRLRATKGGRDFVLFANAFSGNVVDRRTVGRGNQADRSRRPQMNKAQARRTLRRMGYGDIRNLRYRRVGQRDFYQARVTKGRGVFVVRIDDENGKLLNRKRVATRKPEHRRIGMTEAEVRASLRDDGYRRITGIDYVRRGKRDFYVAKAWRDRTQYQLRIDDQSGNVVNRKRIGTRGADRPRFDEKQIRVQLRRAGYRRISDIDYVRRGRTDFYVAKAWQGRVQYRLRVNDETGAVIGRTRIDTRGKKRDRAELSEREIRAELRRDGYRRIDNIRYVDRGRNDFYVARAWYQGNRYRLVVSDEDGDVVNRTRVK